MNQFCHLCEIEFNDWEVFSYHMHKHKTNLMSEKTKSMAVGIENKRMTLFEEALDEVLENIRATLIHKNKKYGDSFFKQIDRYGYPAIMIPIRNKTDRLDELYQYEHNAKEDEPTAVESIDDSHLDCAGYNILTLVYKKTKEQ